MDCQATRMLDGPKEIRKGLSNLESNISGDASSQPGWLGAVQLALKMRK